MNAKLVPDDKRVQRVSIGCLVPKSDANWDAEKLWLADQKNRLAKEEEERLAREEEERIQKAEEDMRRAMEERQRAREGAERERMARHDEDIGESASSGRLLVSFLPV